MVVPILFHGVNQPLERSCHLVNLRIEGYTPNTLPPLLLDAQSDRLAQGRTYVPNFPVMTFIHPDLPINH